MQRALSVLLVVGVVASGCDSIDHEMATPTLPVQSTSVVASQRAVHSVTAAGPDAMCGATSAPPEGCGSFSLTATAREGGQVTGEWRYIRADGHAGVRASIDCLNIVETASGKMALVAGIITHGPDDGWYAKGRGVVAAVMDDTSSQDTRDLAGGLVVWEGATCRNPDQRG